MPYLVISVKNSDGFPIYCGMEYLQRLPVQA